MDKISDILDSIKDRLTNPLFVSFVISWILCNWEITIALIWYNSDYWKTPNSLLEYINFHSNNIDSVLLPIGLALVYVTVNPFAKNLIKLLTLLIDKWGNKRHEGIAEDNRINFGDYLQKVKELNEKEKTIAIVEGEQTKTKNKIQELESKLAQSANDIKAKDNLLEEQRKNNATLIELHEVEKNRLKSEFELKREAMDKTLQGYTDMSIINGEWIVRVLGPEPEERKMLITNKQTVYFVGRETHRFQNIVFFRQNVKVFFAIARNHVYENIFYDLVIGDDGNMKGTENERYVFLERTNKETMVT